MIVYYQFSLPHLYTSLSKVGRTYFLTLGAEGLTPLDVLCIYPTDFVCAPVEAKPYDGKVLNISWSSHGAPQNLFTCGPEGIMIWWRIRRGDEDRKALTMVALHSFRLPPSKQRWASAVEIVPVFSTRNSNERHQLICGDRKGTVHLFEVPKGAATDQVTYSRMFLSFRDKVMWRF